MKSYEVPYVERVKSEVKNRGIEVSVPGSKSITNRALLLATLADGESGLNGVLFSDDSRHFLKCVQALGFETDVQEAEKRITVKGLGGSIPLKEAEQYVGSAGTAARFLTAYLGISKGVYHMDASEQMRKRPMAPLLRCLEELGCEISYSGKTGYFPFTLKGHGFGRHDICVDIQHSSQFLSALLIASALSEEDMQIRVQGTHGMAYIRMTEAMMQQFGVRVEHPSDGCFVVPSGQCYKARGYQIEPDVSAACYFYAMVPLLQLPVLVKHVHFDSLQGDVAFLHILEKMGCALEETETGVRVLPPVDGVLHGVEADMSACSDQAITLAAIAPFADSPTKISGIGHIRFQESDRLHAIQSTLLNMGIGCEAGETELTIYPGMPKPSLVETYDDHRMAMGFSLTGLRAPGIVINDPLCCRKTFEDYFTVFDALIEQIRG